MFAYKTPVLGEKGGELVASERNADGLTPLKALAVRVLHGVQMLKKGHWRSRRKVRILLRQAGLV